jgi:hypothetical protein
MKEEKKQFIKEYLLNNQQLQQALTSVVFVEKGNKEKEDEANELCEELFTAYYRFAEKYYDRIELELSLKDDETR